MSASFEELEGSKRPKKSLNDRAREILEAVRLVTSAEGHTYRYNGCHWEAMTRTQLLHLAYKKLYPGGSDRTRNEIRNYLKVASYEADLTFGRVPEHEVACKNGVLDLFTGKVRAHRPEDYLERVIPWEYSMPYTVDSCPTWDAALADWFGEDAAGEELIAALQEYMGYECLSHAKYKKALVLHGDSDTGKSQVVFVMTELAGADYTCQLSVEFMDDPERRSVIKGKTLNIMSELSESAMIADGGFKTLISTEELILISAKYEPTEMIRPAAKHVIATNNLPKISDKTAATFGRLLILPMERVIPKAQQDRLLPDKLKAEMPGIFAWAIEGAKRLVARKGIWPEPERSKAALKRYRAKHNPVIDFMEECWRSGPDQRVTLRTVTSYFNDWKGGRKVDGRTVKSYLLSAGYAVERQRPAPGQNAVDCLIGWFYVGLPADAAFDAGSDLGGG